MRRKIGMGQYYRPLIIHADGKLEVLNSIDFDNMQKLMEHSWIGNEFANAAYVLIWNNPCKVAWLGDYAADEVERFSKKAGGKEQFLQYYEEVWKNKKKHLVKPSRFKGHDLPNYLTTETKGTYLINHTQQLYISMERYISDSRYTEDGWVWCISPLPLLTACANGAGGSYYGSSMDVVGSWAFDEIEYSDQLPATYKEVSYRFKERNGGW